MSKNINEKNIEPPKEPLKKRGRKPKNFQQQLVLSEISNDNIIVKLVENDICSINNNDDDNEENENNNNTVEEINSLFVLDKDISLTDDNQPILKKRGRKPKGGKIIQQTIPLNNIKETKPNIILHLKCSLKDLQVNNLLSDSIDFFNISSTNNDLSYDLVNKEVKINENNYTNDNLNPKKMLEEEDTDENQDFYLNKENDVRDIWKKLKILQHNLHINNISDKKSACFWCTYEFDNPPIYIPKHYIKNSYHVYGCFCSPECATAYLMEENIDSSSKFERYYLINHIYSKIYDFKKNIKPAPNPYYMLEKYYGNLSIQEYRSLLRNERLFLVVDKPLTRILPELHEDNDDFIINNKIIPSNNYQIKKKIHKKQQSKNNIVNEHFGIVSS
jgi:hypothetical protein